MKFRKIKLLFLSILSIVASGCAPAPVIEYVDVLNFPQFSFEIIDRDECKVSASQAFDLTEAVIPEYVKINSNNYVVTSIGDFAFSYCTHLTSIIIPDSVASIGDYAFFACLSLTSIIIPDTVITIGNYAFSSCTSLTSITIPDSVTTISKGAFKDCSSLTSIIIPDTVTTIGGSAFKDCTSLTSITIPNSVTSIGEHAFSDCSSLQYNKYDKCNYLGNDFNPYHVLISYETKCQTYEINSGCKVIYSSAFSDCRSLASITIPDSVTSIGNGAFSDCSSLTNVYYKGIIEDWCNISFDDYDSNPMYNAQHFYMPNESNEWYEVIEIVIPDSVTKIGSYQLCGFRNLTSVIIPDSVTSIGASAFYNCSSLTSVTIGNSVTSIGYQAFYGCSSLTSIIIPDSVVSIGYDAFEYCSSLTIYCEAKSKSSGWKNTWNSSHRPVFWAGEWEYVNGVPTPIN